jgi:formylmethanofuran--tetrahydromethanopterin N-formyltransferase
VLAFGFGTEGLGKALQSRVGQCVLTCPTTACYNGIQDCPKDKQIRIGGGIRYFGDGFQVAKKFDTRRYWRIPTMDGEFVCEDYFGTLTGVAGGNLLFCGTNSASALAAAEAAVDAIGEGTDVALPFPGGIVRSGSKVGSRYPKLKASTNDAYCPTLRGLTKTELPVGCHAVYEIVIDGLSFGAVQAAMKRGLHAAAASPGILQITAGNYGGKLGKHHFHLKDLL